MAVQLSECTYERVVIFSDRSECKRIVHFDVNVGENDIMICGLPHSIESESIRVEGKSTNQIKDKCSSQPIINDVIYFSSFDLSKLISVDDTESADNLTVLSDEISSFEKESKILQCKMRLAQNKMTALKNLSSFLDLRLPTNCSRKTIDKSIKGLPPLHLENTQITTDDKLSKIPDQYLYTFSGSEYFQSFDHFSLSCLSNYLTFFSDNLFHIQDVIHTLSNEISSISNRIHALELNRKQLMSTDKFDRSSKFCKAIRIIVDSKDECKITLILTYICSNASWKPFYQLSFCTETNELELFYYGIVKQGTGENWKNCPISLSTSSPLFGKPPILTPSIISVLFQSQLHLQRAASFTGLIGRYNEVYNFDENNLNDNFLNQDDIVQINSHHPESNVVFTHTFMASRPTSIPSNNTEHKVSLALIKVLPEFQHISQPELNSNVYLQANVTNSSEFPLLAGYCSVFLDGNFLSKTNLPNVSPQEPFSLSLGADSQVKVSYFSGHKHRRRQQGLFAKSNISTYEFKKYIDVRNNRSICSRIVVRHCLPLSQDDRVKVTLLEPHCKKQNISLKIHSNLEATLSSLNNVEWTLQLQPNEFEKLILKYQIEYPYGMSLTGFD